MITDGYNGLHFTPGNVDDLTKKLNYWQALTPSQKNLFYNNARDTYLDQYTPDKNLEKLISVYKSVLYDGKTKPAELIY